VRGAKPTSSLDEQITEVEAEIGMQIKNYPKFVAEGTIRNMEIAMRQLSVMQDALATLKELRKSRA